MCATKLNPLIDDIFEGDSTYAPELSLLDGERERYSRDLNKARKTMVTVQAEPFGEWFSTVKNTALRTKDDQLDPVHLSPKKPGKEGPPVTRSFDGIFVRDPESLLFKHWARADTENTRLKRGFTFMAIAYSQGRAAHPASDNTSDYWFTLDQERCGSGHLYNVWAQLEFAEGSILPKRDQTKPRKGFEIRGCGGDPWWDGSNCHATLVATPNAATRIQSNLPASGDLADDAVAQLVSKELEFGAFGGATMPAWIKDFSTDPTGTDGEPKPCRIGDATAHDLADGPYYRVAYVPLILARGTLRDVSTHIGSKLWPLLERANVGTTPADFESRHLFCYRDRVVVWNRNGLAIAFIPSDKISGEAGTNSDEVDPIVNEYLDPTRTFVEIRRNIQTLASRDGNDNNLLNFNGTGRSTIGELQRKAAKLQLDAALPQALPLRRLFEAMRIDELLTTLAALESQEVSEAEKKRDNQLQITLAAVAIDGILLAYMQVEHLEFARAGYFWTIVILSAISPFLLPYLHRKVIRQM
jgi:hypothetical protein